MGEEDMTIIAKRAKQNEAKRHFLAGGSVLVSEHGHELTSAVTSTTTTHSGGIAEWETLVSDVRTWRNRYPNQRFYIVPTGA
jgi:hypothetical protein